MGVVRWACGGRRSGKVLGVYVWVWLVLAGMWCVIAINRVRITTFTTLSPEHGAEKRNVMDDNDDGKVMGRGNKEGESETAIKKGENDEEPRKLNNGYRREGEHAIYYHGRKQTLREVFPENYDSDNGDTRNANDDDDDAETDDAIDNENRETKTGNDDGKLKISVNQVNNNQIKEVGGNGRKESNEKNTDGENNKIKEEQKGVLIISGKATDGADKDENEDEEKQQKGLPVTELKPDPDKPADSPKIEKENTQGEGLSWDPPLTFNGSYAINETRNGRPVRKVVLLAYQRSGSSYTGELLASGGSALYTFEPLYPWRRRLQTAAHPALLRDAARMLGDILDCRPEVIRSMQKQKYYFFRRKPANAKDFCKDASIRILKTIRARASFMLPWLTQRHDVKVIHLVRDPRGILSSVKRGGQLWSDSNRDIALQCANIKDDLSLETLGPHRYLRVRYEDLADRQMEVTAQMFSFLGVPLTQSIKEFAKEHTGQDPDHAPVPRGYLNTYRNSEYHHDHWKTELDKLEVQHVQEVCRDVMNFLKFPFVSPS